MWPIDTSVADLKWPWRSFTGCRPFQVHSVKHLCSILPVFNWQHARMVPQRQGDSTQNVEFMSVGYIRKKREVSHRLSHFGQYILTWAQCLKWIRLAVNSFELEYRQFLSLFSGFYPVQNQLCKFHGCSLKKLVYSLDKFTFCHSTVCLGSYFFSFWRTTTLA